jgi:hypothetical protein
MKESDNISIFKGSVVEADQLHEFLAQNNIGSLIRNHMQENLAAGWMSDADHAAEVFVAAEDREKAEALVKGIFHEGSAAEGEIKYEE